MRSPPASGATPTSWTTTPGRRAPWQIILAEAQRRLDTSCKGTLCCVQNRARLVRALYERLDCLQPAPGDRTT
ncbi:MULTISPECIES: hypothetical protein [unclassified Streptomyces]|uniref:hypothetical protein n=1 Tax=unclassified Streptomyces TaxID=2593676 RepID=UPI003413DC55